MADQYKVVTTKGFGNRIIDSIKGIGMGILLFLASFYVLYWNEGRVDLSQVAKTAINIGATEAAPADANGKLVSTTGKVTSAEMLDDGLYLNSGKYLSVSRQVEMYAWVEKAASSSDKNLGGSETTETTYTYDKQWTSSPSSSGSFKVPQGHENPAMATASATKNVSAAKVGNYDIDMANITLPGFSNVTMNTVNVKVPANGQISGDYLYVPGVGGTSPAVGDLRMKYTVLNQDIEATIFGKLNGSKIEPFVDFKNDNARLYRMFTEGGADAAVAQLSGEHTFLTWILRIVGFLMMWIGLSALFGPISTLLDVVPFFGSLSRAMIGVVTFIVALVLSLITIFVSMILHNIYAVVASAVIIVILAVVLLKMRGKKSSPAPVA